MRHKQIDAVAALAAVIQIVDDARTAGVPNIRVSTLETAIGLKPKPVKADGHELVWQSRRDWHLDHPPRCTVAKCPVQRAAHRTLGEAQLRPGRYVAWVGTSGFLVFKPVVLPEAAR